MIVEKEASSLVRDYMKNEKVLIVEPTAAVQNIIANTMLNLGTAPENILLSRRYLDASQFIQEHQPKVVFSEFFVDNKYGLALIDLQAEFYEDSQKVSFLVTENSSDTAVAEAAEGHVDDYVLKPFPKGNLRSRIEKVILKKIQPSDYIQKIIEGKKYLLHQDFDKAAEQFHAAVKIHTSPSLALYYSGYTQHLQSQYQLAVKAYRQSRSLQFNHYKSLMGEFDALYEQKKFNEAYEMIETIISYFPINARRLGQFIIASIYTNHLSTVREVFELYKKIENAPQELVHIYSTAFLTVGRHFIRLGNTKEARASFEYGLRVQGPDINYIDRAVRELVKVRAFDDAFLIFQKIPGELVGGKVYSQLKFLLDQYTDDTFEFIEKGRRLVAQGYADEDCFRLLIQVLVDMKKDVLAEAMVMKAAQDYPKLRNEFNRILGK